MVLRDKVALITGASRGIGRALAVGFAKEGADLVLCARNISHVQAVAAAVERLGRQVLAIQADVSSEHDVRVLVDQAIDRFGRIEILHNNAAVLMRHPLIDCPVEEWEKTMAVNVRGTFLCCKMMLPHMIRQGYGRIINMTSILSVLCVPDYGSYNVSKAAVNALTKTLAQEFAWQNIRINGQHPGPIKTDMNPAGTHSVDHPVPTALYLASLPDGGPTGRFFYNMEEVNY